MIKKPSILFLDAATVEPRLQEGPQTIDFSAIEQEGNLTLHRDLPPSEIQTQAKNSEILITNKWSLDENALAQLPKLKLICVAATGVNHIDLEAAKRRKIAVANVAGYSTQTVAEHTLLFLLASGHRLLENHHSALNGDWSASPHFALLTHGYSDLKGKTLGILGYGAIGKKVSELAKAFGMKVMIGKLPGRTYPKKPTRVSLETLLKRSDFVTLHAALSETTRHLINPKTLLWMKPSSVLLNLGRGPLVDEHAVYDALKNEKLAVYASDVLSKEPPPKSHVLFDPKIRHKLILTPHIAWASTNSRQRLVDEIAKNIAAFKLGKKRNRMV